jgi:hypothetical protein
MTMSTHRKLGNTLWDALKAIRPKKVRAVDTDGKEHDINIPENIGRNRHQHVMQALDGIDWQHVDLLDGKSGLLKRHHRTVDDREPAGELEDIVKSRELSQQAGLLKLMLEAQDRAVKRQQDSTKDVLDAAIRMLNTSVERLNASEARLTRELDTNYQLSHEMLRQQLAGAIEQATGEGGDETMAGQALASVLPEVLQQMFRGKAKEPETQKAAAAKSTKKGAANGHSTPSSERRSPASPGERDREAS